MTQEKAYVVFGALLFGLGAVLCIAAVFSNSGTSIGVILVGGPLAVLGAFLAVRHLPEEFGAEKSSIIIKWRKLLTQQEVPGKQPELVERRRDERSQEYSEYQNRRRELEADKSLPGAAAEPFEDIEDQVNLSFLPSSQPMVPMYFLDRYFRILDWNEAFGLAFDRTMDGRRGKPITSWVYWLENYKELAKESKNKFSDPNNLPIIDIETLEYKSSRYGKMRFKKRAYHIPHDDFYNRTGENRYVGWLVVLEPIFNNTEAAFQYNKDIVERLGLSQLWHEYSISYDNILLNTEIYLELLSTMVGEVGPLGEIPPESRVLDLGAGTGNLAIKLAEPTKRRTVVAMDNSRAMLEILKFKGGGLLREDDKGPGILTIQQDVNSLYGLKDNNFDAVFMNNVLYAVDDPLECFKEIRRVLKSQGEVRISGPRSDSNVKILFEEIKKSLKKKEGVFKKYKADYETVRYINEIQLKKYLYRHSTDEVGKILKAAGFSKISHKSEDIYANQNMLIAAIK